MKRISAVFFSLLIVVSFDGCGSRALLSVQQQKAVDNSIKYIRNSLFTFKDRIDTSIIKVQNAAEYTLKSVWFNNGSELKENTIDSNDWIITVGDTFGHYFMVIVCDSSTCEVKGNIPID